MSPSTKNLRERTERVAEIISVLPGTSAEHGEIAAKVMNLLSSELSLAVKGLRESVCGLDASRMTAEELNDHLDNCTCPPDLPASRHELLRRFDSKAKEILGESS